jgi:signal transduction histidine kinase
MKVATRLNLAVLPAIVGLAVLAALAYWGDRGRQAPELVVLLAVVATLGSAVLSWRSTRFVSQRVAALAEAFRGLGLDTASVEARDEFDELLRVHDSVRALASDQARVRESAAAAVRLAEADQRRHDAALELVAVAVSGRLEEARLALHILQTNPFGELNENQEELVGAARQAADAADRDLRQLARLVMMPTRRRAVTRESVSVRALLDPALAIARDTASDAGVTVTFAGDADADVPPVLVDRLAAQEAVSLLLPAIVSDCAPGTELRVTVQESHDGVDLTFTPGLSAAAQHTLPVLLATSLIDVQAGRCRIASNELSIWLPIPPVAVWRPAARSMHG